MKKLLALLLAVVMVIGLMAACNGNGDDTKPSETQPTQGGSAEQTQATTEDTKPVATNANDEEGPKYGGHLDLHIYSQPTGLDPAKQTGVWRYYYTTCVYENALTRDANNEIAPGVCNYELSEDMLTLKLWVQDGVTFHDGSLVEIEDVVASIERAGKMHANTGKNVTAYTESINIDGDVATIKFTEYNSQTWYYLAAYQPWNAVMPKEICEKYAEEAILEQVEDAIGTGPYKITDLKNGEYISIAKYEGYKPRNEGYTGFAAPKYGYMDSMTFWCNGDSSNTSLALLNGEYDVADYLDDGLKEEGYSNGIKLTETVCNTGAAFIFNTKGTNNICAKYPDLRKAIMAAIDINDYMKIVHMECYYVGAQPCLIEDYHTDAFKNADYVGARNLELSAKYMEAARAAGYKDEPVILAFSVDDEKAAVLLKNYMTQANIPFELNFHDSGEMGEIRGTPDGAWDFYYSNPTLPFIPTGMGAPITTQNYASEAKDALWEQLNQAKVGSAEYKQLWEKLAQQFVDDCAYVFVGGVYWPQYHDGDLVPQYEGYTCYVYNYYWMNPEEHQD